MAGIRIDTPIGEDWTYSLDGNTWQDSPKFLTQPDGSAFVIGTLYTVHCRNEEENLLRLVTIIFGEDTSEPVFDTIAKRGSATLRGWTDQLVKLMGGIITSLPTTDNADLPQVVIDAEGQLWKRGGKLLDYIRVTGPSSFPINQTGQFTATAYYTDGSSGPAVGAVFSVQGVDATINFATGLMTPGSNAVVGGAYTVTASWQGKTHSKGTTLTAASLAFTLRQGGPWYYELLSYLAPDYDGSIDFLNCYELGGWSADKNHPDTITPARVYINSIFAGLATPTEPRPDVSTVNNLTNTTGDIYGFRFPIPSSFRTGGPMRVELKPLSGTNAFRYSPKTINDGCLNEDSLINVAAGKTVTAPANGLGSQWVASNLTDENSLSNYSTDCCDETTPITVQIDLNGTATPPLIVLTARQDNPGLFPVDYVIDGSLDGASWFRMATRTSELRSTEDIIIPVEKNLAGEYPPVRYVRLLTSKNSNQGDACYRVQFAEFKVMAPSFTPLDGNPPTKQPKKLQFFGVTGMNEGTYEEYTLMLIYSDNSIEDVTTQATLSVVGTDITFGLVGSVARLTAATNTTTGDTRSVSLRGSVAGLTGTLDVNIYDASITDFITGHRIDWNTATESLTEGTSNTLKITAIKKSGATEAYTGSGSYSIIEPYPNGMAITTGANAIGTMTLPINSITANLSLVIRFTFPGSGGYLEKSIQLINVAELPSQILAVDFQYFHDVSATFHWRVKTDKLGGLSWAVEWPQQTGYSAQPKNFVSAAPLSSDPQGYQYLCPLVRDTPAQFTLYLRTDDNPTQELALTINRPASSQDRHTIYTAP